MVGFFVMQAPFSKFAISLLLTYILVFTKLASANNKDIRMPRAPADLATFEANATQVADICARSPMSAG